MRRAIIAVLALASCSPQAVERIGPYQYVVTASPKQVFAKANETCAKLGRTVTSLAIPGEDNVSGVRYWHAKVECLSPYAIVSVEKDSYKIWVPTSEIPSEDGCETCVLPHPPTVQIRVKELASDYCTKVNRTMVPTGDDFDLGTGLNFIFSCVPRKQTGTSP